MLLLLLEFWIWWRTSIMQSIWIPLTMTMNFLIVWWNFFFCSVNLWKEMSTQLIGCPWPWSKTSMFQIYRISACYFVIVNLYSRLPRIQISKYRNNYSNDKISNFHRRFTVDWLQLFIFLFSYFSVILRALENFSQVLYDRFLVGDSFQYQVCIT